MGQTSAKSAAAFPTGEVMDLLAPSMVYGGDWCDFRHRQQSEFLHDLVRLAPFDFGLAQHGQSDEGRVLNTLRFGSKTGRRVLVWARQHGDEPDCTAGLNTALHLLATQPNHRVCKAILGGLDLLVIPMMNPDGVARYTRRSAQGIDLNRDAVALASQEARALVALKDEHHPEFCFNLHDMNSRKVSENGNLVSIAFQAGPFEVRDIDNDVRLRAKTVCGIMAQACEEVTPRAVSKYAADYMHRAFGDSMMRWGVSSILIEAGGWFEERGGDELVRRLFALSFLRGLYAVATREDDAVTGDHYATIPFDTGKRFADVLLEKGRLLNGAGRPPFACDVSFNLNHVTGKAGEPIVDRGVIDNLGDLEDEAAKERIDISGHVLMPGLIAIAPGITFVADVPTAVEVASFLRAGITTLVCGVGPFASLRAREQWLETVSQQAPPIHLIAFEKVSALREIRQRHGLSSFAGLIVQDLLMSPEDLLQFAHLYHPSKSTAVDAEHAGRMIAVDLFFQGGGSTLGTQVHLHLTPAGDRAHLTPARPEELRLLVDDFVQSPSQISFSTDAAEQSLAWLPLLIGFGGLSHGRLPTANFLGEALHAYGASDPSGVLSATNLLLLNNARAFRIGSSARIEIDQRADLIVVEEKALLGGAPCALASPVRVYLNGRNALDHEREPAPGLTGFLHLAAGMAAR